MERTRSFDLEQQVAVEAVIEAAALCQAVRTELVQVDSLSKDDLSPVTSADFGSQALICRRISRAFPRDPIVGEEDSAALQSAANRSQLAQVTGYVQRFVPDATTDDVCFWIDTGKGTVAERFWTLDPIDGTKGFLRNDQYAIALALIERGKVQIAGSGLPGPAARSERSQQQCGCAIRRSARRRGADGAHPRAVERRRCG
jgi:3'(2'), 5'-bisphosphate nucleotidase